MGNYEQLKQSVSDVIKTNGNQEITGSILQNVLLTIISSVGANATFAGMATPTTNPGTPDGPVFYLASKSGTYTNFNAIELQDGLSVLMWNGSWSSQQIFGVDDEPTAGSDNLVKSGGVYAKIKAIEDAGYVFAGIATPTTNPGTPDGPVFYLASEAGTYTNFNAVELQAGLSVLMWNGSWNSQQIFSIDNEPTAGSDNLVKSGGVQEELALGAVYDVSAKNPTAGVNNDGKFESLSALLGDANLNTLIPISARKGGMSVKFVQSSDNKYVQARLMSNSFTTDVTQWESVDKEPRGGSRNLIESNAVYEVETSTNKKIGGIVYEETKNTSILSPQVYGNVITVSLIDAGVSVGDIVDLDIQTDNTISYLLYYTKDGGRAGVVGYIIQGNFKKENYTIPLDATGFQVYVTQGATNNKNVTLSVLTHKGSIDKEIDELKENQSTLSAKVPSITICKMLDFTNEEIWRKNNVGTYNPDVTGTRIYFVFPYLRFCDNGIEIHSTTTHNFAVLLLDKNKNTLYDSGFLNDISISPTIVNHYNIAYLQIIARKKDNSGTNINNLLQETLSCNFYIVDSSMSTPQNVDTFLLSYLNKKAEIAKPRSILSIAHQGSGWNSIKGFNECASKGFNAAETDIIFTSDNIPVCNHDATFTDYASSEVITIADVTYEQLQTYTRDALGTKIPSFDDVVHICKLNGLTIIIDHLDGFDSELGILVNIIHKYGMTDKAYYRTHWDDQYNIIRALDVNANFVLTAHTLSNEVISKANLWKTDNNKIIIDFYYENVSVNDIIEVRLANTLKNGIKLCVYTVDDLSMYVNYLPHVDCITSNTLTEYDKYN